MNPEQKFKIGDLVRDTYHGKEGHVTAIFWSEGDEHNKAEWAYSVDRFGWLFIGESELELVQTGIPVWDAVKELTKGVEGRDNLCLNAPLEDA